MSAGFRSAAMLARYFAPFGSQMPERSGLPSAVRGAGALGSTWGVLTLDHWAVAGSVAPESVRETINRARQPSLIWLHSISRRGETRLGGYDTRCWAAMAAFISSNILLTASLLRLTPHQPKPVGTGRESEMLSASTSIPSPLVRTNQ